MKCLESNKEEGVVVNRAQMRKSRLASTNTSMDVTIITIMDMGALTIITTTIMITIMDAPTIIMSIMVVLMITSISMSTSIMMDAVMIIISTIPDVEDTNINDQTSLYTFS